jgi:hypothetical protein
LQNSEHDLLLNAVQWAELIAQQQLTVWNKFTASTISLILTQQFFEVTYMHGDGFLAVAG